MSLVNIVKTMKDPTTKLYFSFLQWVLPKIVGLNKLFQGDGALIVTVHSRKFCLVTWIENMCPRLT